MCIYGLESHPTLEELGIKLGTPGYKASGLSTTPRRNIGSTVAQW